GVCDAAETCGPQGPAAVAECPADAAAADGTSCDDGLFCTVGETCTAGECGGGAASACNDQNDCTKDVCSEAGDECSHSASNNNGPCFDGSLCTTDDVCHSGVCEGGPAKFCVDGNPCTDDACDEATGDCKFTGHEG